MSAAINLFNTPNPALAEVVLAKLWAKSARKEGHMKGLPIIVNGGEANCVGKSTQRAVDAAMCLVGPGGRFTIDDLRPVMPGKKTGAIHSSMRLAVVAGLVRLAGQDNRGCNLYEVVAPSLAIEQSKGIAAE